MAILVTAMPRRKYEITARMNERDYLHIVELALPPGDRNDDARKYLSRHSGHRPRAQAHHPAAGMVSALSCEPKRCTLANLLGLGFWPFFGANCASRFFCSLSG
jgi:hypothetical protein